MRKIAAIFLALVLLTSQRPAYAEQQDAPERTVMGYILNQETGFIEPIKLFTTSEYGEVVYQTAINVLLKNMGYQRYDEVRYSYHDRVAWVQFPDDAPPEIEISDAVARTILMNDTESDHVYIDGESRMDRRYVNLNSNIDRSTGAYLPPGVDASGDIMPHIAADSYPVYDELSMYNATYNVEPLFKLIIYSLGDDGVEFDGSPDQDTAWRMIARLYSREGTPSDNLTRDVREDGIEYVPPERITQAYDALFAYGGMPAPPEDLKSVGFTYANDSYAPSEIEGNDEPLDYAVNRVWSSDDSAIINVDFTAVYPGETSPRAITAVAGILPDSASPFGAKLTGLNIADSEPELTDVATVSLIGEVADVGIDYRHLRDDDPTTGWRNLAENSALELRSEGDAQEVRGFMIKPYHSVGDDVLGGTIRITLSDGNIYENEFSVATDDWYIVTFDGVRSAEWIRLEILKNDSFARGAGISELIVF